MGANSTSVCFSSDTAAYLIRETWSCRVPLRMRWLKPDLLARGAKGLGNAHDWHFLLVDGASANELLTNGMCGLVRDLWFGIW